MDKTVLVEKNIGEGRRLLEALDSAGFRVLAALWFYLTEDEEWRLIIASPLIDEKGPRECYAFVQRTLEQLSPPSDISLKQISIVSPSHDLVKLLRMAISTGPGISGIRFTRNTVNNVLIEDSYIYRMQ